MFKILRWKAIGNSYCLGNGQWHPSVLRSIGKENWFLKTIGRSNPGWLRRCIPRIYRRRLRPGSHSHPEPWPVSGWKNQIFEYVPYTPIHHVRKEKELPDFIQCAIDDGNIVRSFMICDNYTNINTKEDIEMAERILRAKSCWHPGVSINNWFTLTPFSMYQHLGSTGCCVLYENLCCVAVNQDLTRSTIAWMQIPSSITRCELIRNLKRLFSPYSRKIPAKDIYPIFINRYMVSSKPVFLFFLMVIMVVQSVAMIRHGIIMKNQPAGISFS